MEFLPGLAAFGTFFGGIKVTTGAGSRIILGPEDIKNLNFNRYRPLVLGHYIWLQAGPQDWPRVTLSYTPEISHQTYQLKVDYVVHDFGTVNAAAAWQSTQNALFADRRSLSWGCRFPWQPWEVVIDFTYAKRKYPGEDGFTDETESLVLLNIPLGNESLGLTVKDDRKFLSPDAYFAFDPESYYRYTPATGFAVFYESLVERILNGTFAEFIQYLREQVKTQEQVLWLASILSGSLFRYNYGTQEELAGSFFEDTLANTISHADLYAELQYSLRTEAGRPLVFCTGISRFVLEMASAARVEGVESYSAVVSDSGFPHVVTLFTLPDQIYFNDYSLIIPTRTRDIEIALQIYQNLSSLPLGVNFIFDRNGHMLDAVETPDGRLLQDALTVRRGCTWEENLEREFGRE